MQRNRRKNIYLFLFILLCSLGIGYAFLRTELQINGTADFLDAKWDIHFNNIIINPNSVELTTGNTAATISASTTEVTYAVTLKEPGDFYEFTVDAVNAGTIDAMIDTISSKMGGAEITTLPAYMEYSVTYSDGIELAPNQYLKAGDTETYKVHIGFKKDINASDLTGQVENKTLSFSVTYVQADENAIKVGHAESFADDDWKTVINTLKTGNISPYEIGDEKEVDLGTLGTHILRIANSTTPEECSTEGFSQTACGVVLEFADVVGSAEWNNSTNYSNGGWRDSNARIYVNDIIYNALPSVIKNAIIDTYVVSSHNMNETNNVISLDKLYLLDMKEIYGNYTISYGYYSDDSIYDLTRQLDYYKLQNTDEINNYAPAAKNEEWYTRTARSAKSNSSVYFIYTNGTFNGTSGVYGMSPAFRIA